MVGPARRPNGLPRRFHERTGGASSNREARRRLQGEFTMRNPHAAPSPVPSPPAATLQAAPGGSPRFPLRRASRPRGRLRGTTVPTARALAALAGLALGACSDHSPVAPTPPSAPAPGRSPLGLVEITFEASSGGALRASARSLTLPTGLRATLSGTPVSGGSGSGIQLRGAARGLVDLGGTRYLSATFDVRNAGTDSVAYGVSRRNLTFVAVSTAATLAQTPLTVLQRFDGSGYSDATQRDQIARGILPTHAMTFQGGSLRLLQGMTDFQALRESEVAPLGSASLHPLAYGFVVRCVRNCADGRTLSANPAAGQFDGRVTFAVKLPLQASPIDNPFKFSMLFLAVEDADARVTESVEEQGESGAQSRADSLPGAVVTLLGNSTTTIGGHAVERVCRVRTAGDDPAAPLATLVDAGSPCNEAGALPANVRVVNQAAAPGGNGVTWATAFRSLQDALACVRAGAGSCAGVDELWVAQGSYYPDEGAGITPGDRNATFSLIDGVGLYGGFNGSEYARSQRQWSSRVTVLSGDVDNNDAQVPAASLADVAGSNSGHIVTANGAGGTPITAGTVLDGFTLSGGWFTGVAGSAFWCNGRGTGSSCGPTLRNLTIVANASAVFLDGGAGGDSSPVIWNSAFRDNESFTGTGGALLIAGNGGKAHPVLVGASFIHNTAEHEGGAIAINCVTLGSNCSPTLINASFNRDSAENSGAIRVDRSSLTVVNATFRDVRSSGSTSMVIGIISTGTLAASFVNVTITGNHGAAGVPAISQTGGSMLVANSIVWGNTSTEVAATSGTLEVRQSTIGSGCPAGATCSGVLTGDPFFVNGAAGDLRLLGPSSAANSGDSGFLPLDLFDIDGDGNTGEKLPLDLDGRPRLVDSLQPGTPRVDRGAYEIQ